MRVKNKPYRCAIVGTGPRGLFALEQVLIAFSAHSSVDVSIDLFESSDYPGCGPNYAPDQPVSNQLNMPLRAVPMKARTACSDHISITPFPSFQEWYRTQQSVIDTHIDHFPPRAAIGKYLQARLTALLADKTVADLVTLHRAEVIDVRQNSDGWALSTSPAINDLCFKEVLLCIGHQPAHLDSSLKRWADRAAELDNRVLYTEPYPSELIVDDQRINSESCVALRGMGLSMIDVVKSLTIARGGSFSVADPERMMLNYKRSGREPFRIAPFSLDGKPMAPKPVNKDIDNRFRPGDNVMATVAQALSFDTDMPTKKSELHDLLIDLACAAVQDVYRHFEKIEHPVTSPEYVTESDEVLVTVARNWLLDESFVHPLIVDASQPAALIMRRFLDMALGYCPPSLDYCIGQVWKHLQPSFYEYLSFQPFNESVIESAMTLDQRLKRYAFGPPVEAIARLLSLVDAGILQFRIADDPEIVMSDIGWVLCEEDDTINAHCMINTVLSPASVSAMNSDVVEKLKQRGLVDLVHESLGARASANGQLVNAGSALSAAGRLINGSVFEADALVCCFGQDLSRWAFGVEERASIYQKAQ